MKRHCVFPILLCLIFLLSHLLSAQPSIPVDPLTGRAAISIPIWQVSTGGLSAPVSISYSGNGVKVEEGEGSAGLSWNLNAGGSISREVRGIPDDYLGTGTDLRKGWLYNSNALSIQNFTSSGDDILSICADEATDYNFLTARRDGFNDTEPDMFNFHAPGLSGQFVFGTDGLPKLIPYQDLKIVVTRVNGTGPIDQIVITNNVGISYLFSVKESTKRHAYKPTPQTIVTHFLRDFETYQNPLTYISSLHLSRIQSPSGSEILFSYVPSETVRSGRSVIVIDEQNVANTLYSLGDQIEARKIESVSSIQSQANFVWNGNVIERIIVTDTGQEKQFDFVYNEVRDYRDTAPYPASRSFLKEIKQQEDCATYPSHSFTYNGVDFSGNTTNLSFKDKNLKDLWGYYNGTSATNVPDIHVYTSQAYGERLRLNQIPGQTANQTLTGANRVVNPSAVINGSLTQIKYPSGSSATIEFESNQYYDGTAAVSFLGGGLRVKKVTLSGGEKGSDPIVTEYEYLGTNGQSSGRLLYRPAFAFYDGTSIIRTPDNLAPEGGLSYLRTTIKQTAKGKTVYEFLSPAMYPVTGFGTDWNATKSKIARVQAPQGQPCISIGNQTNGFFQFPFPQNSNYDFERGLLDRVQDYNEAGTLVQEKKYSYARLSTPIVLVKGLTYEKFANNFVFGHYVLIANQNKLTQIDSVKRYDDIIFGNKIVSATTYSYSPTHYLLQTVRATNSDNIIHETKYKYAKDYTITNANPSNTETVALKSLNDTNRHGELIETTQSRAGVVTGASITLFKDFGAGKILPHRNLIWPSISGFTNASITGSPQIFSYNTNYIVANTMQTYNYLGMPLSSNDNRKNKSGVHYGYYGTTPLVAISNAYAEEAVYAGFETVTSFQLSYTGGSTVPGWAGENALSIFSSHVLSASSIQKGTNRYRFSCWVKASGTPVLTFRAKNGATIQATGTLTYGGANQWQYLEGEMDMTAVSALFNLEITSNANVELDEIRFYPSTATMMTKSIKPLVGVVAQIDDRGVSSFTEYDELDRVKYIKNKDKHIVQIHDYKLKTETFIPINSEFSDDLPETGVSVGQSIQFTSPTNCGGVTYQWKVNNQIVSTSASYTHNFSVAGAYQVILNVSSIAGSAQSSKDYCIKPAPQITLTRTGTQQIYQCEAIHNRSVTVSKGLLNTSDITFQWVYRLSSMNVFTSFPMNNPYIASTSPDGATLTFNLDMIGLQNIEIKCIAAGNAILSNGNGCDGSYYFTAEQVTNFIYVPESYCP
jgi:hypothetical protein